MMMMNPALMPGGTRAQRAYSVNSGTAYQNNARYGVAGQQPNTHDQPIGHAAPPVRFVAIAEDGEGHEGANGGDIQAMQQADLLQRYMFQSEDADTFGSEPRLTQARDTGSQVIMKRTLRSSLQEADEVDREINVLCTVSDKSIPILIESLELRDVIWTINEHRPLQSIGQLVKANGPMSEVVLKTALNQLFSGIAALFYAGFAHLRICDQTVSLDANRQVVITDFKYACQYDKEKVDDLYAATTEKYGSDIYVAPEVFACDTYNARKAVIWSCGVLLYYMTTGETDGLSNLAHPSFDRGKRNSVAIAQQTATNPGRKVSVSNVQSSIILYPNRFRIPDYARWIIPKMLMLDPLRRAELIEVATRVPKDYSDNSARPLVEMAWLDYKEHVGPLAGIFFPEPSLNSSASSIYSIASAMSNPFRSLMGRGHSRRQSAPVGW